MEWAAMSEGEFLTKASVWLALIAYAMAMALNLEARGRDSWRQAARWVWTLGCAFFVTHVLFAFGYFHHWSHAEAYRETARQTAALTGWNWGGGIYFNYVFAAGWIADVLWWWLSPRTFVQRPKWVTASWQGFFFFMVFNGAIVFGHGPVRLMGTAVCLLLAALWWRNRALSTSA
jgi:hypothetical protein